MLPATKRHRVRFKVVQLHFISVMYKSTLTSPDATRLFNFIIAYKFRTTNPHATDLRDRLRFNGNRAYHLNERSPYTGRVTFHHLLQYNRHNRGRNTNFVCE